MPEGWILLVPYVCDLFSNDSLESSNKQTITHCILLRGASFVRKLHIQKKSYSHSHECTTGKWKNAVCYLSGTWQRGPKPWATEKTHSGEGAHDEPPLCRAPPDRHTTNCWPVASPPPAINGDRCGVTLPFVAHQAHGKDVVTLLVGDGGRQPLYFVVCLKYTRQKASSCARRLAHDEVCFAVGLGRHRGFAVSHTWRSVRRAYFDLRRVPRYTANFWNLVVMALITYTFARCIYVIVYHCWKKWHEHKDYSQVNAYFGPLTWSYNLWISIIWSSSPAI